MIKELKYILLSIGVTIKHDFLSSYDSLAKPKDVLNLLFWIFVIEMVTGRYKYAIITFILYILVYFWKIIKQGDWKRRMRVDYKLN